MSCITCTPRDCRDHLIEQVMSYDVVQVDSKTFGVPEPPATSN